MTLSAGTRLGQYEIISELGAGGMGEVYRARDTKLGREIAVKPAVRDERSSRVSERRRAVRKTLRSPKRGARPSYSTLE